MGKPIDRAYLLQSFKGYKTDNLEKNYIKKDSVKTLSSNDFTDEYKDYIDYYYKLYVGDN